MTRFHKVRIEFDCQNTELAEELICDIFFSFKLKGVICDIPLSESLGYEHETEFSSETITDSAVKSIIGFLPFIDSSKMILRQIAQRAAHLSEYGIDTKVTSEIVDEKDWAEAWKDYFEVTKITERIVVKPEWKSYQEKPGDIVIHLDPGMAFGTGTHPTTFMCLQLIEKFLVPGGTFLDIGTGSGILMIAAAKLGAAHVSGIDNDETAIDIAGQNLDKNGIDRSRTILFATTLEKTREKQYDLMAANIIAHVIIDIMPEIRKRMAPAGTAIFSGIIKERLADVEKKLKTCSMEVIHQETVDEWVSLAVKKW